MTIRELLQKRNYEITLPEICKDMDIKDYVDHYAMFIDECKDKYLRGLCELEIRHFLGEEQTPIQNPTAPSEDTVADDIDERTVSDEEVSEKTDDSNPKEELPNLNLINEQEDLVCSSRPSDKYKGTVYEQYLFSEYGSMLFKPGVCKKLETLLDGNDRLVDLLDIRIENPITRYALALSDFQQNFEERLKSLILQNNPAIQGNETMLQPVDPQEEQGEREEISKVETSSNPSDKYKDEPCFDLRFSDFSSGDKIGMSTKFFNCVRTHDKNLRILNVLDFGRDNILSLRNSGAKTADELPDVQEFLRTHISELNRLYEYEHAIHYLPELSDEQKKLSLNERLKIAVGQFLEYSSATLKIEQANRIKMLFCEEKSVENIAQEIGRTIDRVNQLVTELRDKILYPRTDANIFMLPEFLEELYNCKEDIMFHEISYLKRLECAGYGISEMSLEEIESSALFRFLNLGWNVRVVQNNSDNPRAVRDNQGISMGTFIYEKPRKKDSIRGALKNIGICLKNILNVPQPLAIDEITDLCYMSLENNSDPLIPTYIRMMLEFKDWYEEVDDNGVKKIQLKFEYLSSFCKKAARLIYYKKGEPISAIELCQQLGCDTNNIRAIDEDYNWVLSQSINTGFAYSYAPHNVRKTTKTTALEWLRIYSENLEIVDIEKCLKAAREEGYNHPDGTFVSYLTQKCQPKYRRCYGEETNNLFCREDVIDKHPEHKWRNTRKTGKVNFIINAMVCALQEANDNKLQEQELINKIFSTEGYEEYNLKYPLWEARNYIASRNHGKEETEGIDESSLFYKSDKDEYQLNLKALENVDLDTLAISGKRRPEYYDLVISTIVEELKTHKEPVKKAVLFNKCKHIFKEADVASTKFYKLLEQLPDEVETIDIDGCSYLKWAPEKLVPIANYKVVDETQTVEVESQRRPTIEYTTHRTRDYSWSDLYEDLQVELSAFINRRWFKEYESDNSLERFIEFATKCNNDIICREIPRTLYELWHFQTDRYDRMDCFKKLCIGYEGLLREICLANKIDIGATNGINDIGNHLGDFNTWINVNYKEALYFPSVASRLKMYRNRIAHSLNITLTDRDTYNYIVQFVALYVFTMEKYLNERFIVYGFFTKN